MAKYKVACWSRLSRMPSLAHTGLADRRLPASAHGPPWQTSPPEATAATAATAAPSATSSGGHNERTPTELTAVARLLAGMAPVAGASAELHAVAQTEAGAYTARPASTGTASCGRAMARMDHWQNGALPAPRPDAALIYPFSGPDFVNAFALFPHYKTYVFFRPGASGRCPGAGPDGRAPAR